MALDHFFLHRVERSVSLFQTLHGFDRLAVKRRQQLDTGIGRYVVHARASGIEFTHHHHTRATVSLSAAFLGSGAL